MTHVQHVYFHKAGFFFLQVFLQRLQPILGDVWDRLGGPGEITAHSTRGTFVQNVKAIVQNQSTFKWAENRYRQYRDQRVAETHIGHATGKDTFERRAMFLSVLVWADSRDRLRVELDLRA